MPKTRKPCKPPIIVTIDGNGVELIFSDGDDKQIRRTTNRVRKQLELLGIELRPTESAGLAEGFDTRILQFMQAPREITPEQLSLLNKVAKSERLGCADVKIFRHLLPCGATLNLELQFTLYEGDMCRRPGSTQLTYTAGSSRQIVAIPRDNTTTPSTAFHDACHELRLWAGVDAPDVVDVVGMVR